MKEIKTVGIIGLGALGVLYTHLFTEALGKEHVLVLADKDRAARYRRDGVWYNGQPCAFTYADAAQWEEKAKDLASRFVKNFTKYTSNEAGKALVAAGPQL